MNRTANEFLRNNKMFSGFCFLNVVNVYVYVHYAILEQRNAQTNWNA